MSQASDLATSSRSGASSAQARLFDLDEVTFSVPERRLLAPLSLTIDARRVIGLIGHNGSGKSTLLKLLARQQPATSGVIRFEGAPLRAWRDRAFARKVGYLPQTPPPATGMLVKELVALGRYPWHGALGPFRDGDRAKTEEAMALTDVEPFADRLVDTLSGGERQRVWLAMLIAQDAECLLLDEPISALDVAHQIEVLSLVRRLSKDRNLGVVAAIHDVNMAARFCDEILAMRAGALIARGPPSEVMTPEGLQEIYGIRMGVIPHPDATHLISFVQ